MEKDEIIKAARAVAAEYRLKSDLTEDRIEFGAYWTTAESWKKFADTLETGESAYFED